jgi:acetolactate synthase I/II/III large subunit
VKRWQCESSLALQQLLSYVKTNDLNEQPDTRFKINARTPLLRGRFSQKQQRLQKAESFPENGQVTVPYFMSRFRTATKSYPVVALNESTTNLPKVADHLFHEPVQSLIGGGGSGIGWYSGAAVGAHLGLQPSADFGKIAEGAGNACQVWWKRQRMWTRC